MPEGSSTFDPRFDPAFQPGFEGEKAAARPKPPATGRDAVARPTEISRPAPAAAPAASGPAADRAPTRPRVSQPEVGRVPGARPPASAPEFDDAETVDPPRRSPLLIVLGILSVALIVAGIVLTVQLPTLFAEVRPAERLDITTITVLMNVAPQLIALGLATAIALLFVLALRRR